MGGEFHHPRFDSAIHIAQTRGQENQFLRGGRSLRLDTINRRVPSGAKISCGLS
jgi:hypothetical protein